MDAASEVCDMETLPGLADRFGIDAQQIRTWKSRTTLGRKVPVPFPDPDCIDSAGKELWHGPTMDAWWRTHPSNPERVEEPEAVPA